jgi:sarcosine oxidase
MNRFEAAVIGLGGMGAAVAAHLSKRGIEVCAFEQYQRGHDRGASSGRSRIIRKAYFEDPAYVPLLHRSYDLWQELAAAHAHLPIWDLVGLLIVADGRSQTVEKAARSASLHGVPFELLSAGDILQRYPMLRLRANERGLFEPQAGAVFPENALEAYLHVAQANGAQLHFDSAVISVEPRAGSVRLTLAGGEMLNAGRVAICAGPWLSQLVDVGMPLRVQRNVQLWFTPSSDAYVKQRFPAFFLEREGLPEALYGLPDFGDGLKAALHGYGVLTTPAQLDREIHTDDIAAVKEPLDEWLPGAASAFAFGKACMYTLTPDLNFIIDTLNGDRRVVVAGGFSGHGYKFCPVIGEIVADLLLDGKTRHDIGFLRIR